MRSTTFLAAAFAAGAIAVPVLNPRDEVLVTKYRFVDPEGNLVKEEVVTKTVKSGTVSAAQPQQQQQAAPASVPAPAAAANVAVPASNGKLSSPASGGGSNSDANSGSSPSSGTSTTAASSSNVQGGLDPAVTETNSYVEPGTQLFRDMSLYFHNVHRANHSAPDLKYDVTLETVASLWAAECSMDDSLDTAKSKMIAKGMTPPAGMGINIGSATNDDKFNPSDALTGMYNEVNNYPAWGQNDMNSYMGNFQEWGHFSQMVWPKTESVGCSMSTCGNTRYFGCAYHPAGNVAPQFAQVQRPLGHPQVPSNEERAG